MKRRLRTTRSLTGLSAWLLAVLLLTTCGALPTNPPEPTDDVRSVSPIATVSAVQTSPIEPSATARPTLDPLSLVVLHTNDNWGETEPCG